MVAMMKSEEGQNLQVQGNLIQKEVSKPRQEEGSETAEQGRCLSGNKSLLNVPA